MKKNEPAVMDDVMEEAKSEPRFWKDQIMKSKRYANRRDALSFLLKEDQGYTYAEIENILDTYMKGKVN